MEIRRLTPEDLDDMAELFVNVFSLPPWSEDWSHERAVRYLSLQLVVPEPFSFGLFIDNRPVALEVGSVRAWWKGDEAMIGEFCVRPDLQGQGIGGLFLAEIKKKASEAGLASLCLITDRNHPAFSFYEKHGFSPIEDNVMMALDI
ncbi:MAG: GNAT family N-acetyltransferase [Bullifex sp.]